MESTFTTPIENFDCLELHAPNLKATIEAVPGLTEATIEMAGPEKIVSMSTVDRSDNRWILTVPEPESTGVAPIAGGPAVNAWVHVPAGIDLQPRVKYGEVRAEGMYGAVDFRSFDASLELEQARELKGETRHGSITSSSTSELIDVNTYSGTVDIGSAPQTRVRTRVSTRVQGHVRVSVAGDHDIRVFTTDGNIDILRGGHTGAQVVTSALNGRERFIAANGQVESVRDGSTRASNGLQCSR